MSTVVHASGCAPLLLYVLLYRTDAYSPGQLGRSLTDFARSTSVGLFVPKPTREVAYHHSSLSDLPRTVRGRPLASAGICGGCYSFGYSPAKGRGGGGHGPRTPATDLPGDA